MGLTEMGFRELGRNMPYSMDFYVEDRKVEGHIHSVSTSFDNFEEYEIRFIPTREMPRISGKAKRQTDKPKEPVVITYPRIIATYIESTRSVDMCKDVAENKFVGRNGEEIVRRPGENIPLWTSMPVEDFIPMMNAIVSAKLKGKFNDLLDTNNGTTWLLP